MAQVTVTIAGHTYRMACAEGEEEHLKNLASLYDGKIASMRGSFGEIGDMRLHVMAALTLADELAECRKALAAAQRDSARATTGAAEGGAPGSFFEAQAAETLGRMADRIERIARSLQPAPQPGS